MPRCRLSLLDSVDRGRSRAGTRQARTRANDSSRGIVDFRLFGGDQLGGISRFIVQQSGCIDADPLRVGLGESVRSTLPVCRCEGKLRRRVAALAVTLLTGGQDHVLGKVMDGCGICGCIAARQRCAGPPVPGRRPA
jgi:hypothetical protein